MKKYLLILAGLCLILTGCAAPDKGLEARKIRLEMKQQPPADFIPKHIKIVSIGDSLTKGVGSELNGYIDFLQNDMEQLKGVKKAEFHNFGVKGNRTDQLLKRLQSPYIRQHIEEADMVIITIGGNDIMQVIKDNLLGLKLAKFASAEEGYRERLKQILATIREYNDTAAIILVGIYNPFIKWFSDIHEMDLIVSNWNKASAETAAEFDGIVFVPVDDIFKNKEESLLYTDYFHPNSRGYELIAKRIFEYLKKEHHISH
jgi:lysophospholipase L1-like esterase